MSANHEQMKEINHRIKNKIAVNFKCNDNGRRWQQRTGAEELQKSITAPTRHCWTSSSPRNPSSPETPRACPKRPSETCSSPSSSWRTCCPRCGTSDRSTRAACRSRAGRPGSSCLSPCCWQRCRAHRACRWRGWCRRRRCSGWPETWWHWRPSSGACCSWGRRRSWWCCRTPPDGRRHNRSSASVWSLCPPSSWPACGCQRPVATYCPFAFGGRGPSKSGSSWPSRICRGMIIVEAM